MLSNWRIFQRERFPLHNHLLLILALLLAHVALAGFSATWAWSWVTLFFVLLSFFFRMRLFDEIKDYAVDCEKNPSRPLPRGVLGVRDLQRAILILFCFELALTGIANPIALVMLLPAQGYSFLMYREFFIGKFLRRHLTTYAVSHTVVMVLLSALCSVWLLERFPWQLETRNWVFAIGCFGIFNVFEFGRKTFAKTEEQPGIDSYSTIWGHSGAVILNMSQGLLGLGAMGCAYPFYSFQWLLGSVVLIVLFIAGIAYILMNTTAAAKIYRSISGASILFILCVGILYAVY
ncbi:MAG: manganese transporter permease [Betaproteobacteria bacterium]|nr:manganese transporter permease [Betaproteobacteria bacterium]